MSLEAQAADRKARLAALRNKNKVNPSSNTTTSTTQDVSPKEHTSLISRNFDPESRSQVRGVSAPPTTLDENSETVEAVSQAIQDKILAQFREEATIQTTSNVIKPKKITWDLERDLQNDMELLDEKTDEVIKALVKDRIRKLKQANDEVEI